MNVPFELIEKIGSNEVLIVDVRTAMEYIHGHVEGSRNIPFEIIPLFVKKLKEKNKPVILCSSRGFRSSKIAKFLKRAGIEAYDGGDWEKIKCLVKN